MPALPSRRQPDAYNTILRHHAKNMGSVHAVDQTIAWILAFASTVFAAHLPRKKLLLIPPCAPPIRIKINRAFLRKARRFRTNNTRTIAFLDYAPKKKALSAPPRVNVTPGRGVSLKCWLSTFTAVAPTLAA